MAVLVRRPGTDRRHLDGLVSGDFVGIGRWRERGDPERRERGFARLRLLPLQLPLQPLLFFPRNPSHFLLIQLKNLLPLPVDLDLARLECSQCLLRLLRLALPLTIPVTAAAAGPLRVIILRRLQPHAHKLKLAKFPPPRILERPLFVLSQALPGLFAFSLETFDLLSLREEIVDGAFATEEVAVRGAGDGRSGRL